MANETTTTTANDISFAAWVGSDVLDEIRPYLVGKPHMKYEGRKPSKAFDFPIMADPGAAASNQTEGTAFANTALSTDKATATARLNGIVATVTDFLDAVSLIDAVSYFTQVLSRSCAEEYEVTIDAQFANFANVTGTSGADLTVAQFLGAISALEQRDAIGNVVAILHPVQVGDLRTSVQVTANAFYHGNSASGVDAIMDGRFAGSAGSLFDVELYMSSAVPTANAGADRAGGVFVSKVTNGLYEVWDTKTEQHRDAFQPGTQLAATSCYGVAEIRDVWGQAIITDA
jgi:hypothetical protein